MSIYTSAVLSTINSTVNLQRFESIINLKYNKSYIFDKSFIMENIDTIITTAHVRLLGPYCYQHRYRFYDAYILNRYKIIKSSVNIVTIRI